MLSGVADRQRQSCNRYLVGATCGTFCLLVYLLIMRLSLPSTTTVHRPRGAVAGGGGGGGSESGGGSVYVESRVQSSNLKADHCLGALKELPYRSNLMTELTNTQNHTVMMVLPDWRTATNYPGAEWYEVVWRKHEYGMGAVLSASRFVLYGVVL
jgi:hypothetical protein